MTQMTQTLQLPGYEITELVYHGSRTRVYRGRREIDQHPVAIKVLQNETPDFNDLLKFRNQYTLTKNLDHPQILKSLSLESYGHGYALILDDFGGISLANYWLQYQSTPIPEIPLEEFLKIAIQLTQALNYLYQNRIIHKDIKPANILINPQTHEVKCIDFSIASQLPRESQELDNINTLEGTLAYLSPEQTGRMNRGIDYRSDFYSLGVTFYELLTGTLPFNSDDTLDLIHSHLAVNPPPVHHLNPAIPLPLSQLVSQLMAKNAEDRYQTALGIQADLQVCLDALQTSGHICEFTLGERDISDRLMIPEKLYGRAEEVKELLMAFDRVSQGDRELMLVAGFSGIGKTSLIQEVHKPIIRQRGYFIKGKYDQFNRNIPLSGLVQALRDLVDQILSESEENVQIWGETILEAIGDQGQVLVEVIPELELLIGTPPPVPELSGVAAETRLNLLFTKFIKVFASADHPLVIFLDDLQWADWTSLKFLKILLDDQDYLLMLGAYRDNEVSRVHPLILTLDELTQNATPVKTLTLSPLDTSDLNQLVADTLQCDLSRANPLTDLITRKTQGNPFFATQFIKYLYEEQLLSFDWQTGFWQADLAQIKVLAMTDDVVEFMALQLRKLPASSQNLLQLAACVGAEFDFNTLEVISQTSISKVITGLWNAIQQEFVIPTNQIYKFFTNFEANETVKGNLNPRYRFVHDRIQQAAYSLIPEEHKQATHLQVGRLLQEKLADGEREERCFEIVGHLNLAPDLIRERREKEAVAQLNLVASRKALKSTAYPLAQQLVETGMSWLEKNPWETQYSLSLALKTLAVETAYLTGNFELMNQRADEVLAASQTVLDRVKIYQIQISSLTAQGQMLEAIQLGQKALLELGVHGLEEENSQSMEMNLNMAVERVSERLGGKTIEDLVHEPQMTDAPMKAAMDLCALLFPAVYQGSPQLQPLLCATMVSLSLEFGNSPASTLGYGSYGMVLSAFLGDVEQGYRFGKLALNLVDSLKVSKFKSLNLLWFGGFIQHRKESLRSTRLTMRDGYLAGMDSGDFLNAGYNLINYFYDSVFAGVILEDWEREIQDYADVLESIKQESPLTYLKMSQQMAYQLKESFDEPDVFKGPAYDETQVIPKYQQNNELSGLAYLYTYKIMLAYWFGKYRNALEYVSQAQGCLMALSGTFFAPVFEFYAALSELALYSELTMQEQAQCWERVQRYREQLVDWSRYAPMNHHHRLLLLDAEMARVLAYKAEALDYYDRAIAQAKTSQYLHEEALANERAAQFYWEWGKTKLAEAYLQEAYYGYARWGAKAKVLDLERRFSESLDEILHPSALDSGEVSSRTTKTSHHTSGGSSSSISEAMDLEVILKVSQTISEEIELNKLIHTLLTIVVTHAGADNCLFLLQEQQDLKLFTLANLDDSPPLFLSKDSNNCEELPMSLINRVKRTLQPRIIADVNLEIGLLKDKYFQKHQPKSILVTPIIHQGKLRGILYLENNLMFGAFTGDRIKLLNLICSQAAISLENARLYESAQKAFTDLQEAQLHIVQSEKMSTLGNLVAGVAHEINNPVGFLKGNIDPCLDYIQDLLGLIDLYQEKYPDADEEILEEMETIELDYIREDFPKSLNSMREGVKRIQNISHSLRSFSRGDTRFPVTYDVHEGLDSTLLILKHRLKANDCRPAINVIKDYGELPNIQAYAGQLNQVFANLIGNAIDAVEENSRDRSYHEIDNRLVVKTRYLEAENQVMISIQDNGTGMTDMVKKNMFDKLFTTKEVGKGTGLGLPISRQIVMEKHSGTLECHSQFGEGTEFQITLPTGVGELEEP
ncbi:ATP-binding sensor histidine kinase [Geitlerinema sp. P-1104]|uniref:trifunctional serine/threonine-protein kinase/ATP-binding protein/sensor histidine kinase n=1 Tax=Geitlerinema sp. P-1104 TaxID=2546230 RepID=UPI00256FE290|nr:ATP-binding sensor histidine kinase [Geitlerinema sp. P-1104]